MGSVILLLFVNSMVAYAKVGEAAALAENVTDVVVTLTFGPCHQGTMLLSPRMRRLSGRCGPLATNADFRYGSADQLSVVVGLFFSTRFCFASINVMCRILRPG